MNSSEIRKHIELLETKLIGNLVPVPSDTYMVLWSGSGYKEGFQIVSSRDFDKFFNENNGYDEDDIAEVKQLQSGDFVKMGMGDSSVYKFWR